MSTERATTLASPDDTFRMGTVEHLFAALAGLGIYGGLEIEIVGEELPFLDGGSSAWVAALSELALPSTPPELVVRKDGMIAAGASVYTFARGPRIMLRAKIDYGDARLAREAHWNGEREDFVTRIAPARSFVFARDLEVLSQMNPGAHVSPESVLVFTDDEIHWAGRPFTLDEPARHKVLDLMGDLYLYGGPPLGGQESGASVVSVNVIKHFRWTINGEAQHWPDQAETVLLGKGEWVENEFWQAGTKGLEVEGADNPSGTLHLFFSGGQSTGR